LAWIRKGATREEVSKAGQRIRKTPLFNHSPKIHL
jgi:hypothetical protein